MVKDVICHTDALLRNLKKEPVKDLHSEDKVHPDPANKDRVEEDNLDKHDSPGKNSVGENVDIDQNDRTVDE